MKSINIQILASNLDFLTSLKNCMGQTEHVCVLDLTKSKKAASKKKGGFPGGAVVENLLANAGDTGSSPGLGRFPHAAEQLGP